MNLLSVIIYSEGNVKINHTLSSIYKYADQIILITNEKPDGLSEYSGIEYIAINQKTNKVNNLNVALNFCNSKWILYLNNGESLYTKDSFNIRNLISSANSHCGGFLCNIADSHLLNDSGSSKGFYPRLFLNDTSNNIFFKGILFEQSSFSIVESGNTIYPSNLIILQNETTNSIDSTDSIVFLNKLSEDSRNEFFWYELGLNYSLICNLDKAEDAFIQVFDFDCSFYLKELASLALSNICRRVKRIDDALLWAEIAYDLSKDKTSSLQALANAHLWNLDIDNAKKYFRELEITNNSDSYKYYHTKLPQIIIDKGLDEISKIESSINN